MLCVFLSFQPKKIKNIPLMSLRDSKLALRPFVRDSKAAILVDLNMASFKMFSSVSSNQ